MTTETPERKYALRKVGKGDWLLPANDVETSGRFWRLSTYEEGPSHGSRREAIGAVLRDG